MSNETKPPHSIIILGIVCSLLLVLALVAGCTSGTTTAPQTTPTTVVTTVPSVPVVTTEVSTPVATTITSTPTPVYTSSEGNLVVYTAASLTGASSALGKAFEAAYPGHKVTFNLAGTQTIKEQVEAGAYADVFISASNKYTTALKQENYFINSSVKTLCYNYVVVITPKDNPGNIQSLADLGKSGKLLAIGTKEVPVGIATNAVIDNLANSTYGQDWKDAVYANVKSYETAEPGVANKVALGEVDAGFVYESTYKAASAGTYNVLTISKKDNYLQTYSIGVLREGTNKDVANEFEQFMLSSAGQDILSNYGFTPAS
jgi:molybdate transport system substrate-binding protein